jgi:riboflavin biosynthesis pyrimidine reductase
MTKFSLCILLPALAGCYWTGERIIPMTAEPQPAVSTMTVRQDDASLEQRFSDSEKTDSNQMITIWAQRYDELSKQYEYLRQEHVATVEQSNRLQQEATVMKMELEQTRKELQQSNALLQDAHIELSKWKADVLGFREEIRQAQTAQLLALSKILRILGAESMESQIEQPKMAP